MSIFRFGDFGQTFLGFISCICWINDVSSRACVKGCAIARTRAPQVAEARDSSRAQIYDFLHNGAKLYGKLTELIANM